MKLIKRLIRSIRMVWLMGADVEVDWSLCQCNLCQKKREKEFVISKMGGGTVTLSKDGASFNERQKR